MATNLKGSMGGLLDIRELGKFLESWYDLSMSVPDQAFCPMLISPPGIGKTSFVKQLADKKGVHVFNLILSQANPSEVAGMVMPDPSGAHRTIIYDPQWAAELQDGDILFLDEVLKAPQATLNSCLTMIQERRLASGTKLPKVAIISAANYTPQARTYAPELKQRFQAIEIVWNNVAWKQYMQDKYPWCALNKDRDPLSDYTPRIDADVDGTKWNQLSPRDAEKMLVWAHDAWCDKEEYCKRINFIELMYDKRVADAIIATIEGLYFRKLSPQREQLEGTLRFQGYGDWVQEHTSLSDREFCLALKGELDIWNTLELVFENLQVTSKVELKES